MIEIGIKVDDKGGVQIEAGELSMAQVEMYLFRAFRYVERNLNGGAVVNHIEHRSAQAVEAMQAEAVRQQIATGRPPSGVRIIKP